MRLGVHSAQSTYSEHIDRQHRPPSHPTNASFDNHSKEMRPSSNLMSRLTVTSAKCHDIEEKTDVNTL